MSATTKHQTEIIVPEGLPIIELKREFDAPVDKLFRAWVDEWDCSTGGRYRYASVRGDEEYGFYGSFHEVRENERIVQTFTFEGEPDGVALEIMTLESLPDGRSRIHSVSIGESVEGRDAMVASGMETGIVEGFEKLDELLAR